jgi:predicted HicB family RNase H-like nuclease
MANPRGRPSPPPKEALHDRLSIRCNEGEQVAWKAAAEKAGVDYSSWVRAALNRAAKRQK